MKEKKRVLVEITYGMSFRNIVLNKTFWDYLTRNFEVDLITPLNINESDIRRLGVSKIYDISHQSLGFFRRLFLRLNYKALEIKRLMDLSDFFLRQHHGWPLVSRFHQSLQDKDWLTIDLFFWPAIKRTFLGKYIRSFLKLFPVFHPISLIIDKNKYEFLINTHSSEYASVLNAQVANKHNLPVICFPMGLDNIMHGPILFKPDRILFWGEDQMFEFNKFQINWNNDLSTVEQGILGNMTFDAMRDFADNVNIRSLYGLDKDDDFVLFCTMVECNHPGQVEICEDIIELLKTRDLEHKLIIRMRPGFDEKMWSDFQSDHPNRVILQMPSGASFDKSNARNKISLDAEYEDVSIYSSTLNQSSMVISRAHSTTYTDALFMGTPSVVSQYYPLDKRRSAGFEEMWKQVCTVYPHHKEGYSFAFNNEDLKEYINSILAKEADHIKEISTGQKILLEKQLNSSSGMFGKLAIEQIEDFIHMIRVNEEKNEERNN